MTVIEMKFRAKPEALGLMREKTLFAYMHELVAQFQTLGRERSAETYMAALKSFCRYRNGQDLPLADLDESVVVGYESYLRAMGLTMNTSSFYMRVLRAAYNRAVGQGYTIQRSPFKHVYTGIDKTAKRAVSIRKIRQIKDLDLSARPDLALARDMFLFSFYTRGMSLIDMMYLTPANLCGGRLVYSRRKTGQYLSVRWEHCMQEIVERYRTASSYYLLPLISVPGVDERRQYRNRSGWIRLKLRTIGEMVRLDVPLTMYVARHSWASIARVSNVPVSVISEGMGHDSERTTQIYLSSLDYIAVDKANRRLIQLLR